MRGERRLLESSIGQQKASNGAETVIPLSERKRGEEGCNVSQGERNIGLAENYERERGTTSLTTAS